jgi:hypothetical protein
MRKNSFLTGLVVLCVLGVVLVVTTGMSVCTLAGCSKIDNSWLDKITFNLEQIHENGLRGPSDGLVAVSYEFCIPANKVYEDEIRRIDPTVQIHHSSSGRIGCGQKQWLCIGSTHRTLACLDYINRIDECFFE